MVDFPKDKFHDEVYDQNIYFLVIKNISSNYTKSCTKENCTPVVSDYLVWDQGNYILDKY